MPRLREVVKVSLNQQPLPGVLCHLDLIFLGDGLQIGGRLLVAPSALADEVTEFVLGTLSDIILS
jgi:hypothetical protein